jgi:hypothetical protein
LAKSRRVFFKEDTQGKTYAGFKISLMVSIVDDLKKGSIFAEKL